MQTAEYLLAEPVVIKGYEFAISQCDVVDKKALAAFRDRRRNWLVWLETDEHHAIGKCFRRWFGAMWSSGRLRTLPILTNKAPCIIRFSPKRC
jgi:hypothetical protein